MKRGTIPYCSSWPLCLDLFESFFFINSDDISTDALPLNHPSFHGCDLTDGILNDGECPAGLSATGEGSEFEDGMEAERDGRSSASSSDDDDDDDQGDLSLVFGLVH
jgi:hypothetical protein